MKVSSEIYSKTFKDSFYHLVKNLFCLLFDIFSSLLASIKVTFLGEGSHLYKAKYTCAYVSLYSVLLLARNNVSHCLNFYKESRDMHQLYKIYNDL